MSASTVSHHLQNSDGDASAYVRSKRIKLAHEIKYRAKVYLDAKFWALLRDVRLGRSKCNDTKKLLAMLESSVADGTIVCPLNADVYFEVFKQNDESTLIATAQLIDDLSLGVCLIPIGQRLELEIFHFIESSGKGPDAVYELDELVWTKTAYQLGFVTPDCYTLPEELNTAFQKAFADHMWTLGLIDMLNMIGPAIAAAEQFPFEDISADLNKGKFDHIDDHASFKSVFLSEVQGILDVHKRELSGLFGYIYERDSGQQLSDVERNDDTAGQALVNLIYHAFRLNRITNQFPTVRIGAGLHAALRWDRKRKYKPNDTFDFRHAAAALPYCDYFFTERALHHLLKDGNLRFKEYFDCKTVFTSTEALAALEARTI